MPPQKQIKYAPIAVDDMDEIFSYITQENVAAAGSMLEQLDRQIKQLAEFPQMGSILPEDEYSLVGHGYRFIVIQPYLVFYRILEDIIVIHRILHGRRDYLRELFDSLQ